MTTERLEQVQQLVDELTPLEQIRLLEYLTPRIANAVIDNRVSGNGSSDDAWQNFFRVGDELLLASPETSTVSLTAALSEMRR